MSFLSHLDFIFGGYWSGGWWSNLLPLADGGSAPGTPSQPSAPGVPGGDTLVKMLDGMDLGGARTAISGVVRAIGFGPEADNIATVILGLFVVLVIIGYAAGPRDTGSSTSNSAGTGGSTTDGTKDKK